MKLQPNKIYVTLGGTATSIGSKTPVTWGYDRVKFLRYEKEFLIVQTPWDSEVVLPSYYKLEETKETQIRSEFPLLGSYESLITIPFADALTLGLCKEIEIPVQTTINDDITNAVITYLFTPQTVAATASHFGVRYQKIRYIIKQLKAKGYGGQSFHISQDVITNKIQIKKV